MVSRVLVYESTLARIGFSFIVVYGIKRITSYLLCLLCGFEIHNGYIYSIGKQNLIYSCLILCFTKDWIVCRFRALQRHLATSSLHTRYHSCILLNQSLFFDGSKWLTFKQLKITQNGTRLFNTWCYDGLDETDRR